MSYNYTNASLVFTLSSAPSNSSSTSASFFDISSDFASASSAINLASFNSCINFSMRSSSSRLLSSNTLHILRKNVSIKWNIYMLIASIIQCHLYNLYIIKFKILKRTEIHFDLTKLKRKRKIPIFYLTYEILNKNLRASSASSDARPSFVWAVRRNSSFFVNVASISCTLLVNVVRSCSAC